MVLFWPVFYDKGIIWGKQSRWPYKNDKKNPCIPIPPQAQAFSSVIRAIQKGPVGGQ